MDKAASRIRLQLLSQNCLLWGKIWFKKRKYAILVCFFYFLAYMFYSCKWICSNFAVDENNMPIN